MPREPTINTADSEPVDAKLKKSCVFLEFQEFKNLRLKTLICFEYWIEFVLINCLAQLNCVLNIP